MLLSKEFTFDSAHYLTQYHGQCERLHGHTYRLRVTVEGPMNVEGMVMDFKELKRIVKEQVVDRYDHHSLNDFFDNPSAEWVVKQIWEDLVDKIQAPVRLFEVVLWETADSFVTYRGEA